MTIPMIDLREQLNTTAPEWRQHLDELFEKMHFVLGGQVASFERELAEYLGAGGQPVSVREPMLWSSACGPPAFALDEKCSRPHSHHRSPLRQSWPRA